MKVLAFTLISALSFLQFLQVSSTEEDICSLGSETGPCKASFPRWFYDVKKGKCSQFIYGGCDGNKNNFRTEEECEKRCDSEKTAEYPCFRALQKALGTAILVHGEPRPIHKSSNLPMCDHEGYFLPKQCDKTKGECWCVSRLGKEILNTRKQGEDVSCDVCSLPKVVGPCFAAFPRWFFNKASGKCEQFIYGGCKGNGNNFEGEKECQAMCLPHKLRLQKAPTKCQKEALEATQIQLVGRFIPQCNPDGSYNLIQCHASTGYCWCSNPDGTKYPGTDVRGKPNCEKYKSLPEVTSLFAAIPVNSKCQQERLEATQSHLVGRFIPRCNDDGTYQLIQCHASTAYCWCAAPDGTKYRGTDVRFKEPNCDKYRSKTALSKCQREALGSTRPKRVLVGRFIPKCNEDGSYQLIQCHGSTGYCWCSTPDGTKFPGTDVPPGKQINCDKYKGKPAPSKCQQEVLEATKSHLIGRYVPQCNEDGSYQLIQCHGSTGYCWCSTPDGIKFPGTDVPPGRQINCDKYKGKKALSKCQQEALGSTRSKRALVGRFIPKCNEDGSYQLVQCHGSTGYCWCSTPDGTKFPGTDIPPGKQINCDKYNGKSDPSKCQQEVLEATKSHLMGRFVPQCNEDGSYQLIQCHGSTGYCWCSTPDGTKFPGSDVPPGKQINCDKYKGKSVDKCLNVKCPSPYAKCRVVSGKAECRCPIGCALVYSPVCGTDGNTYANECVMKAQACKLNKTIAVGKQGKCGNDKCKNFDCSSHPYQQCRVVSGKPQCQCQLVCTLEYLPVCGSDSRTYGNLCMLKAHACETKKLITVSKIGECDNIKEEKSSVQAGYQEKQTQNIQSSSPASSGSSTAVIVLSVCAALCVMAVAGVVLVRRRRGSSMYGKLRESSFKTIGEKQPLVNA